ncbi:MAG: hypothetical protein IPH13_16950 [Planctomycetes bacterium]|nr:hypothetical protein [Planctomycetota bacterium]
MTAPSKRRRRHVLLASAAAAGIALALLPAFLGTSVARPLFERILTARMGFGVAIESASLSWRGPQELRGCAIASAEGFGGEPLFAAESVRLDGSLWDLLTLSIPGTVELQRPALTVIRAPGGTSNLDRWLERHPAAGPTTWPRIEIHDGRARIEDRGIEARLDADGIEVAVAAGHIAVRARIAGNDGVGRLVVETSDAADGTRSSHIEAHGFDLGELDPLLRPWLPAGARCVGRCAFDLTAKRQPDGFVEFDGAGAVRGLAFPSPWLNALRLPLAFAPGELSDPQLSFEGRVTYDPSSGGTEFDRFVFRSTFLELTANGSYRIPDAATPIELRASVNFDFLARRGAPLLGELPFLGGSGFVVADVSPIATDTYRVVARGERANFALRNGLHLDFPEAALETTARVDSARDGITWSDFKFETRGGTLTGDLDWRGADEFEASMRWVGDWQPVETFFTQWEFGTFWDGGGEFDATARWSRRGTRSALALDLASADLALQLSPRDGNFVFDDYFFRGTPFTAKIAAEFDPNASVSTWSGSLVVDAPGAVIRDDTFANLAIAARLSAGVVSIERCEGRVHDGFFRAGGSITLRDGADAAMAFEFEGRDLELGGHTSEWSGQICPVFATAGGPYRVTGTPRLTGSIAVSGTGYGLRSLARNARGEGRMSFTAGTLKGSDLLAAVVGEGDGADGVRVEAITTDVRIDNARVHARSSLEFAARPALVIDGSADWTGRYEFEVDAQSIVPPALFERHRADLESRRFALRGNAGRPQFALPDLKRWAELDARGELAAELERLPPP